MEWVGDVIHLAVIGLFVVVLMQRERGHAAERRDLLDRLMSRDIEQYKAVTAPEPGKSEPAYVSEAEEWAREIEQMKSG